MSLRAFHIVFIALSTLLTVGFGAWCFKVDLSADERAGYMALGVTSFVAGALLLVYGSWFLRKLKAWE